MTSPRDRAAAHPEEHYRVLVEQAADGIFLSDARGVYVEVNVSGHRLLGYAPGELIGAPVTTILRPQDLPRLASTYPKVLRGVGGTEEWIVVRKDGSLFDAEITTQRLEDGRVLAVLRDVTLRKNIERQTQASEARLRSVLATAPDVIMTVDRAGTILFLNRTAQPVNIENVLGSCCFDHVVPESRGRVVAAIEHVFSTAGHDEYEVLGPANAEGNRVWFAVRVGPVIENDEVVAATFCASDITPRKREEQARLELLERMQKMASQVPGMVCQFKRRPDGKTSFPYASEGIRQVLRVAPEDVREDASLALAMLHPEDYDGVLASIHESGAQLTAWRYEFRVRFSGGEVRWLFGNAIPQTESDGSVLWHGFITDVTQEKAAETAKAQLEEQLRQAQKMESIGRLAGGVAHDFNNLLTSVLGFTELALADLPEASEVRRPLEHVLESALRGATLTQQLLAFARKKIVRPENIDVTEIVRHMVPMIGRLVGEHLELVLTFAEEPCVVKADLGSLEQIVMNLVVNARDAMPQGGRLTLKTELIELDGVERRHPELTSGAYVVLTVSDTGAGMTPEVKAKLFEPFFTTKPVGEGTGLGLAMCHGMVKQAGGSISVRSELGRGTTFRIFLPRVSARSIPVEPPKVQKKRVEGDETLLIVEDEPRILSVAESALTRFGYRVLSASDGPQALALVARCPEPIQLLVTDVIMPRMSGKELALQLSKLRPGLKVLYCSGYTDDAIAAEEGADFLQKPYTPSGLAQRIRDVLDR